MLHLRDRKVVRARISQHEHRYSKEHSSHACPSLWLLATKTPTGMAQEVHERGGLPNPIPKSKWHDCARATLVNG